MGRTWNTTGLYKASKDRMPAKRSHRIKAVPPSAKLVPIPRDPECPHCGFGLTTKAHAEMCPKGITADSCDDISKAE